MFVLCKIQTFSAGVVRETIPLVNITMDTYVIIYLIIPIVGTQDK